MYVVWPNSGVFQIFFKRITLGRCWNYGNKWDIFCKIVIFGTVTKSHQVLTCSHQPATLFAVWWVIFVRRNYNYLICVVYIHRDSFSLRKHFTSLSNEINRLYRNSLPSPVSHESFGFFDFSSAKFLNSSTVIFLLLNFSFARSLHNFWLNSERETSGLKRFFEINSFLICLAGSCSWRSSLIFVSAWL